MSKKHKHDLETRIQIVKEYQSGQISLIQIGKKYGLRGETVRRMVKRYETEGTEGLRNKWTIVNKMDKKMCTKKKNK